MIERAVTLLPEPDSPTIPSVSPGITLKLTPSTARTMPASVSNCVRSSRTSRIGSGAASVAASAPAGQAGEFGPPHHQHGDHRVGDADAERGGDRHGEDDRRKAEDEIGEPHQRLLDPAPGIGGDAAEQGAEGGADGDYGDAAEQRDAGAVEQAGEGLAGERAGAEQLCAARASHPPEQG